jgi:hypothetical protein
MAVEMTDWWKAHFASHRPWKTHMRFPHSHRRHHDYPLPDENGKIIDREREK